MGTPQGQAGGFEQSPGNCDMALSATDDLDLIPTDSEMKFILQCVCVCVCVWVVTCMRCMR